MGKAIGVPVNQNVRCRLNESLGVLSKDLEGNFEFLSWQALKFSHVCKNACSEEVPELMDMGGPTEGACSSRPHC